MNNWLGLDFLVAPLTQDQVHLHGQHDAWLVALAYLVAVNPAPGQPPAVEAKPGSDVPGYGKVVSITQRGMAWEILTERGTIAN